MKVHRVYDDESGRPQSMYGEILSIKDVSGNGITEVNHIANVNPIRYRFNYAL